MREGQRQTFKNTAILSTMLNFRLNGIGLETLALWYKCDVSTIRYQCDLYWVEPAEDTVYSVQAIIKPVFKLYPPQEDKWVEIDGERVNKGKSYDEYFRDTFPHRKKTAYW